MIAQMQRVVCACSLTTSAAILLGGTVGNYDVYGYVDISPVLSGMFFVTLFFVLSFFSLTVLTAIVLRKYDNCANDIERRVAKLHFYEQVRLVKSAPECSRFVPKW